MKLIVGLFALGLALVPTAALAGAGLNLRWNACAADGGSPTLAFACNRNTGFQSLVGSFELGSDIGQVIGLEITIDVFAQPGELPAWWLFSAPGGVVGCRGTALSLNPIIDPDAIGCVHWTTAPVAGGLQSYRVGQYGPGSARILAGFAVQQTAEDLIAGREYFAINVRIQNSRTVGNGACGGCEVPVRLMLSSVNVVQVGDVGTVLSGPTNGFDSNLARWTPQVTPCRRPPTSACF